MLRWISIFGGLLIMMGHHARSEALFYCFRLEDQVHENHLLRLIDKHIKFEFVPEQLKDSYSENGRCSIDPELLLRILLIDYLYGITSERKLVEELRMHLAWRWFTGLGFDQENPHHSTFSKNRHGRFEESSLFEELFEQIVRQCVEVGLVQGKHLSVDGSFVEANAAKESRIPREQLAEAAQVNRSVRQYLVELEEQNPLEEPVHLQDQVSTTDPDSTYATKGGTPARLGYYDNYLVDNPSCVTVGVQATGARMSQETVAAHDMPHPFRAVARTRARIGGGRHHVCPFYGSKEFTASPQLRWGMLAKTPCTSAAFRCLLIHLHEPARQRARHLASTPEFAHVQRQRKNVEALFAELKHQIGLRRLRLRRLKFVREQFFLERRPRTSSA